MYRLQITMKRYMYGKPGVQKMGTRLLDMQGPGDSPERYRHVA